MKTSLIIPSYNGRNKLPSVLDAISQQTKQPDELIVVLDGSTDGSKEWIENNFSHPSLILVDQENKGRAGSRNAGANQATGDLLIFIDDDIRVEPSFIEMQMQMHQDHPNSICSGTVTQDVKNDNNKDFYLFRQWQEKKWIKHLPDKEVSIGDKKGFIFTFAAASIEKHLFDIMGGFDNRLNDGEDFDFGIRFTQLGYKTYYNPLIVTHHQDYADIKKFIFRHLEYIKSRKILLEIHPEYLETHGFAFNFGPNNNLIKKIIRKFFVYSKIWEKIIQQKWLMGFFPQNARFTLYDWIISSTIFHKNGFL